MPQQQFNSEGLLEVEDLQQLNNKQIVIFRGEVGRELLAQSLRQRGAQVEYAEVYRRIRPECDTSEVQQAGLNGVINIAIVTSNEGLQNLYDMVGESGRRWLLHTPLAVVSQRNVELAQKLGFKSSVIAKQASDEGLVDAVKEWYAIHTSAGK
jgi:uroporphyrinogen-III synthase